MPESHRRSPKAWATNGLALMIVGLFVAASATATFRIARSHRGAPRQGVLGSATGPAPTATPQRVRIPSIDVDAPITGLGLNADGTLEVPPYEAAGWYKGRPKPGDSGAAVIAAHVDSTTGPAVFYHLSSLAPDDVVSVDYDDGTSVDFAIGSMQSYPKSEFPTEAVYGPTDGPELRLITCGGTFDRESHSYRDNVVVWATAIARHTPALA